MPHERLHDGVADVGFEQRPFDRLQTFLHVGFGQLALAANALEGGLKAVGKRVEHDQIWRKTAGDERVRTRLASLSRMAERG